MNARGWTVIATLALALAACAEDPSTAVTRQVIQDLAGQRYGPATSRYRQNEEAVLSPGAAPLWREAIVHDDSTVREWAVDSLARIGLPQDVDAVVGRLDDPSRGVRRLARDGLVIMAPERAAEEFGARVGGEDPEQVVLAAEGLAALGSADAVTLIVARLQDPDLHVSTRGALAQPLATLGDPAAAAPLADVAMDPAEAPSLRRLAAEALVALEGPGVEEQIARLPGADDDYVASLGREALRAGEAQ